MTDYLWMTTYEVTLRVYDTQGDSREVCRAVTVDRRHGPSAARARQVARDEALAGPDVVRVEILRCEDAYRN